MRKNTVTQDQYKQVKKYLQNQNRNARKQASQNYGLSPKTIKRIEDSPTYPAYKILVREHHGAKDWLIERGYEEIPLLRRYVKRLHKA